MTVGSISPRSRRRDARTPWRLGTLAALARTALVLGGLGFVFAALAAACLDHYDEGYGGCVITTVGIDCGTSDAATTSDAGAIGSGSGSGAF